MPESDASLPRSSEIVGRQYEFTLIDGLLATLSDEDASRVLLLSGEPGVGKTALLDVAVAQAAATPTTILRAAGAEFAADVSYAGLSELLMLLHAGLQALGPASRDALKVVLGLGPGAIPSPLVVANAALELICDSAHEQPVLIVVDDVHWLDRCSAVALAFIARRTDGHRIGVVGAIRSGFDFALYAGIPEHEIAPLSASASSELLGTRFPLLTGRTHQRLLRGAQGNPLALLELAASVAHPGRLEEGEAIAGLTERLSALYKSRVLALPAETRQVLLLAALEDDSDIVEIAYPAGAVSALAPAERDHLIVVDHHEHRVRFHHPLVRATVVEAATDVERRRAHQGLAAVMDDRPERRAWHLAQAAVGPDEQVAQLLVGAAHVSLDKGAVLAAVTAFTRAAELSGTIAGRGRRLIAAAALQAEVIGELGPARDALDAALAATPDLGEDLQSAVVASHILLNSNGDLDQIHRLLVSAIDEHAGRDGTDETLVAALHVLLVVCWLTARPESWRPVEAVMRQLRPPVSEVLALSWRTFGDPAHQSGDLVDRLDAQLTSRRKELNPVAVLRFGIASLYVDRLSDCRPALDRVINDGRHGAALGLATDALTLCCAEDWLTGQWDRADELFAEGAELCQRQQSQGRTFLMGRYVKGLIDAARGTTTAGYSSEDLPSWIDPTGSGIGVMFVHHIRALSAAARGDFERAYRHACTATPPGELAAYQPHALWLVYEVVESAVRTGRLAEARAHVEAMRRAGIAAISPRLALLSAGCAALIAVPGQAGESFEMALAVPGASRWAFDAARIRLAYGEHLRHHGTLAEARSQLESARESFANLDAAPWQRRTAELLRAVGSPIGVDETIDLATLTPLDLTIATMAARGMTNREISRHVHLSHRTVGAHLSRLFSKLGITSRAALHDALAALTPASAQGSSTTVMTADPALHPLRDAAAIVI